MRAAFIGQAGWRLGGRALGAYKAAVAQGSGGAPASAPAPPSQPLLDFTAPDTMSWTSTDWIQTRYDNATGTYNPVPMVPAPYSEYPLTTPMIAWPHVYSEIGRAHV